VKCKQTENKYGKLVYLPHRTTDVTYLLLVDDGLEKHWIEESSKCPRLLIEEELANIYPAGFLEQLQLMSSCAVDVWC